MCVIHFYTATQSLTVVHSAQFTGVMLLASCARARRKRNKDRPSEKEEER
jgi:hypothetical protein